MTALPTGTSSGEAISRTPSAAKCCTTWWLWMIGPSVTARFPSRTVCSTRPTARSTPKQNPAEAAHARRTLHASECIALIHHFLRQVLELIGTTGGDPQTADDRLRRTRKCQGRPEALLARQEHRNDAARPSGRRTSRRRHAGGKHRPRARASPPGRWRKLLPLAQHAERRFHGMDIVGLAVDRESAEFCNEPAQARGGKTALFLPSCGKCASDESRRSPRSRRKTKLRLQQMTAGPSGIFSRPRTWTIGCAKPMRMRMGRQDCTSQVLRKTAHTVTFFRMSFRIASMLSCSVMPEVSSSTASSAGRSGAMARLESRSSRAIRSARTAS